MSHFSARAFIIALTLALVSMHAFAAETDVLVNAPFSDPPFSVTPGYTVSYTPSTGIDLTVPSAFPQPNTDVMDDNKFGVSLNYGGTGFTVLTSRYLFENSPDIALTVGNLPTNESFEVFVRTFVNTGFDFYGGRYGFESGQLTSYFYSSGGTLIATGQNGPSGQGQFQIREFDLGSHLSNSGQLTLYLDDFDQTNFVGNFAELRLVPTPEPSTLILAALGGLALLAYRRRK